MHYVHFIITEWELISNSSLLMFGAGIYDLTESFCASFDIGMYMFIDTLATTLQLILVAHQRHRMKLKKCFRYCEVVRS